MKFQHFDFSSMCVFNPTLPLSTDPVPAGFHGPGDQGIVKRDEAEDMFPRHSQEGAEGQGEEVNERKILHHLPTPSSKSSRYTLQFRFCPSMLSLRNPTP